MLLSLLVACADASPPADLTAYRWTNRLLLLFAPAADHPSLLAQRAAFAGQEAAVVDRRLLVVESVGGDGAELRRRFGVAPEVYLGVLVGLDGGEKRRESEPLGVAAWFATIDAMPMRARELARRQMPLRADDPPGQTNTEPVPSRGAE
ncbi:MAG: DUF4174 domain-containing protein [Myxococcota bacterium]